MSSVCSVCGGQHFNSSAVLWPKLVDEWQLSGAEVEYVDRQQGKCCTECGANLRSIALSNALLSVSPPSRTLIEAAETGALASRRMLEVNEAGTLHDVLRRIPDHTLAQFPEVDMHALPYPDESFDIVVHSDTLEHVENPMHALSECRRVLKKGGFLVFTVPVIVGRLSRGRAGLPKSYHGNSAQDGDDYIVHTEFGADAWTYPLMSGFSQVAIHTVEFPAALAFLASK